MRVRCQGPPRAIALTMALALLSITAVAAEAQSAQQTTPTGFPARVLITNDNGIDDPKVVALARAFAPHAETWVIAPAADRSGSGSYLTVTRTGTLIAERRDLGPGIRAFAVDGYPADCVVLGLLGIMRENLPDLVISGINGGANLGADWFGSGTVGAARIAAVAGIRAIAVSGLDDDLPGAVEAAVDWVVRLAGSAVVQMLDPPDYLTISMPRLSPDQIRGVRVADRAPLRVIPRLRAEDSTTWRVVGTDELDTPTPADSDQALWEHGYIVVVPMRADEVHFERLVRWRREGVAMPAWRPGEH